MGLASITRVLLVLAVGLVPSAAQLPAAPADAPADAPLPLEPLTPSPADYPLEALLAGEEGRVVLNVQIGTDGRVGTVFVERSSGSATLDAAATYYARSRWRFDTKVSATILVEVPWILPNQAAQLFEIYVPAPASGTSPATRRPPPPNAPQINDYPDAALRLGESGIVGATYRVLENGTVGEIRIVESSGSPRLDEMVHRMLTDRWRFDAATSNGKPVAMFRSSAIAFIIPGAKPTRHCHRRPVIAQEETRVMGRLDFAPPGQTVQRLINKWIFVAADGAVADALLLTTKGWIQLGARGAPHLTQGAEYPKPTVPAGCWYFDPVPISG